MSLWNRLANKTWNRVERGCAPVAQVLAIYPLYLFGLWYMLQRDDRHLYIDPLFAFTQLLVGGWIIAGGILLLVIGLILRTRRPDSLLYQYVGALFFALSLVWAGYVTGSQSLATGVVLIGAALAGYIALERRVIFVGVVVSFVLILLMNIGANTGFIPYAPLLVTPFSAETRMMWMHIQLFLAAPHMLMYFVVIGLMVYFWRKRERAITRLSLTDALTGLHNRRSILEHASKELARSGRHDKPVAVAVIDLDNFKQINDRWGHAGGDRVLTAAARCLKQNIRQCDVIGRFGGEEFLVLLPDSTSDDATTQMERCRVALEQLQVYADTGERIAITGSFGVACNADNRTLDLETLVSAADQALYEAKSQGRNRIALADTASLSPHIPRHHSPMRKRKRQPQVIWLFDQLVRGGPVWTPVRKTVLILFIGCSQLLFYSFWTLMLLTLEARHDIVNVDFVLYILPFCSLVVTSMIALASYGFLVNRHNPNAGWYQYLGQFYYAAAFIFFGYLVGTLSMPVGIILVSGPLIGMIFFELRYIVPACIVSVIGLVALTYASAFDVVPYAPIMPADRPDFTQVSSVWLLSFYVFVMPYMITAVYVADMTFGHWRERGIRARELSRTDMLTGIPNRRSILDILEKEIARTWRHGPPLAVALLDLDHFKKINDTWGHPVGDAALLHATRLLQETLRQCDTMGRFGGEEFMLVLPDTSLEGAQATVERCREILEKNPVQQDDGSTIRLTASFGLTCNAHCMTLSSEQLIRAADDALYDAKRSGRNRVSVTLWALSRSAAEPG